MRRSSALLLVLAVAVVIIGGITWAGVRMHSVGGFALVYPISHTSEIDVNVWLVAPDLRVMIRRHDTGAATIVG